MVPLDVDVKQDEGGASCQSEKKAEAVGRGQEGESYRPMAPACSTMDSPTSWAPALSFKREGDLDNPGGKLTQEDVDTRIASALSRTSATTSSEIAAVRDTPSSASQRQTSAAVAAEAEAAAGWGFTRSLSGFPFSPLANSSSAASNEHDVDTQQVPDNKAEPAGSAGGPGAEATPRGLDALTRTHSENARAARDVAEKAAAGIFFYGTPTIKFEVLTDSDCLALTLLAYTWLIVIGIGAIGGTIAVQGSDYQSFTADKKVYLILICVLAPIILVALLLFCRRVYLQTPLHLRAPQQDWAAILALGFSISGNIPFGVASIVAGYGTWIIRGWQVLTGFMTATYYFYSLAQAEGARKLCRSEYDARFYAPKVVAAVAYYWLRTGLQLAFNVTLGTSMVTYIVSAIRILINPVSRPGSFGPVFVAVVVSAADVAIMYWIYWELRESLKKTSERPRSRWRVRKVFLQAFIMDTLLLWGLLWVFGAVCLALAPIASFQNIDNSAYSSLDGPAYVQLFTGAIACLWLIIQLHLHLPADSNKRAFLGWVIREPGFDYQEAVMHVPVVAAKEPLNPGPSGGPYFSLESLQVSLNCSLLAYRPPHIVNRAIDALNENFVPEMNRKVAAHIISRSTDTQAYVVESVRSIMIFFRGTSSIKSFKSDLSIAMTELDDCLAHFDSGYMFETRETSRAIKRTESMRSFPWTASGTFKAYVECKRSKSAGKLYRSKTNSSAGSSAWSATSSASHASASTSVSGGRAPSSTIGLQPEKSLRVTNGLLSGSIFDDSNAASGSERDLESLEEIPNTTSSNVWNEDKQCSLEAMCQMWRELRLQRKTTPRVHKGFYRAWKSVASQVADVTRRLWEENDERICIITGHSLGAAIATLCAYELSLGGIVDKSRIVCYTFGSPRIGNAAFASLLQEHVPNYLRVILGGDPITKAPSSLLGFRHGGKLALFKQHRDIPADLALQPSFAEKLIFHQVGVGILEKHLLSSYFRAVKSWILHVDRSEIVYLEPTDMTFTRGPFFLDIRSLAPKESESSNRKRSRSKSSKNLAGVEGSRLFIYTQEEPEGIAPTKEMMEGKKSDYAKMLTSTTPSSSSRDAGDRDGDLEEGVVVGLDGFASSKSVSQTDKTSDGARQDQKRDDFSEGHQLAASGNRSHGQLEVSQGEKEKQPPTTTWLAPLAQLPGVISEKKVTKGSWTA